MLFPRPLSSNTREQGQAAEQMQEPRGGSLRAESLGGSLPSGVPGMMRALRLDAGRQPVATAGTLGSDTNPSSSCTSPATWKHSAYLL